MSWAGLAIALSGAGVLVTGALAALFLRDPVQGWWPQPIAPSNCRR